MKFKIAWRRAKNLARPDRPDQRRINTVNNPAYSSTIVDADTGRRSLMGTGRKDACTVLRETTLPAGAPRTAVVLGVARGGTSMVSGVLRGLAVVMGDNPGFNPAATTVQRPVSHNTCQERGAPAPERPYHPPPTTYHLPPTAYHLTNTYTIHMT